MKPKYKRRRLLVHPEFQIGLVVRMGAYVLIATLAVLHTTFALEMVNYVLGIRANGVRMGIDNLYLEFLSRQKPFLVTLILVMPILLYDLFKFSNRIAGPLHRCRRLMQDMIDGKPVAEFKPRERDLMKDYFATFDALIKKWNSQVAAGDGNLCIAELTTEAESLNAANVITSGLPHA